MLHRQSATVAVGLPEPLVSRSRLAVHTSDLGLGRNKHIARVLTVAMTGFVESVHFLIIIGGRIVKSVVNFILLVILSQDLKTGSVLSVVTSIMLVEPNAIVVSASRMKKIDPVIEILEIPLLLKNFQFIYY